MTQTFVLLYLVCSCILCGDSNGEYDDSDAVEDGDCSADENNGFCALCLDLSILPGVS